MKKVQKNWSHELKCTTSCYYENVGLQGERQTKNHWHIKSETCLLCYQDAGDKLTALFEPCLARGCSRISFEIRRSMDDSVATSSPLTINLNTKVKKLLKKKRKSVPMKIATFTTKTKGAKVRTKLKKHSHSGHKCVCYTTIMVLLK